MSRGPLVGRSAQQCRFGPDVRTASISMMLPRYLTAEESGRLDRVNGELVAVFHNFGHSVRVCEATGKGESRRIGFIVGIIGHPVLFLKAAEFLAASDGELLSTVTSMLEKG
jgi:hypothetical protein